MSCFLKQKLQVGPAWFLGGITPSLLTEEKGRATVHREEENGACQGWMVPVGMEAASFGVSGIASVKPQDEGLTEEMSLVLWRSKGNHKATTRGVKSEQKAFKSHLGRWHCRKVLGQLGLGQCKHVPAIAPARDKARV